MDYGNNGGRRYISIKGMKTNVRSSKASGRFTLMVITDIIGEPVLCIFILAAKNLSFTDVKGFYYRASIPYESIITMEGKNGGVKALPGLPVCKFSRKLVPGLMCMSSKGSIISNILPETLKYLDRLNVFERRQDGPTPFGLLGGHGSRLQLPLL